MRIAILNLIFLCLSLGFGIFGCADAGAEAGVTAAECVDNDLIAQCPPNTMPSLEADSEAECSNSAGGSGDALGTSVSGESVCVGSGNCQVVCELITPCEYGIASVSPTDGVVCAQPTGGCGDGTCGAGENPTDCPQDCATECNPNSSRCTSGQLERCTPRGTWEDPVACEEGSSCVEADGSASCMSDE